MNRRTAIKEGSVAAVVALLAAAAGSDCDGDATQTRKGGHDHKVTATAAPPQATRSARADALPPPDEARFQVVRLVAGGPASELTQPMRMAIAPDGRVIYIERDGRVKIWSPGTQNVVTAGAVAIRLTGELGMVGLALAPDFVRTGHIYLHYSPPDWETSFQSRVSRWTLTSDNRLDSGSEVRIIDIQHPTGVGGGHSAGDLQFTPDGDLFIATGDNTNCCASLGFAPLDELPGRASADAQRTAANSSDLNGKILRIHPLPGGSYSIPDGNLFPLQPDGKPQAKTRPEVYAMGLRNPFTIGDYDPASRSLWIADYGPDAVLADPARGPAGHVEMNLMTQPGFYGWPYCIANNLPYNHWDYATNMPREWFDCAHPQNRSPNNTGVVDLPAAMPATIYWGYGANPAYPYPDAFGGGAMAGPMYRYDPNNPSTTKFPEWFDGRRFFFDWTTDWIASTLFSSDLMTPVDIRRFLPNVKTAKPMDLEFGPDGSLYVLAYGNGWGMNNDDAAIYRIDYVTGNRVPDVAASTSADSGALPLTVNFDATRTTDPDGDSLSYAWDFDGDGTTDATGATASKTYTTAGTFAARLTVTDSQDGSAILNFSIVAGNARPTVEFLAPVDGGFNEFGTPIRYRIKVTDPEEATIDCTQVLVTYQLGHNTHAHPMEEGRPDAGCEGTITPSLDSGHTNSYVYSVLQATYTDGGGAGGTPALTGATGLVLHPHQQATNVYPRGEGVGLFAGELFIPASGNWFMFPRIDVAGIGQLNVEFATRQPGVVFSVRADSPAGPLVARIDSVPYTGSTSMLARVYTFLSAPVTDPRGTHDLYFVSEWAEAVQPELFIRTLQFAPAPTAPGAVDRASPAGARERHRSKH